MKTHFERVYNLRTQKEQQEQWVIKKHVTILASVMLGLVSLVLLGALVPGFYRWLDSMHPLVQVSVLLIPMGVFAFWRLKKMMKL